MLAGCTMLAALLTAKPLTAGDAQIEVDTCRGRLTVFTYKPADYADGPLIVVCHGVLRNAQEYRDHARAMADRFGAIVAAPRFPLEQFSIEQYQKGGLKIDGAVQPLESCTWFALPDVVEAIRRREGRAELPCYLIGHSGGAQFLVRLAGFVPTQARRIVVANPGTYLLPSREAPYPYGFGELPDALSDDETLQKYLAQPLTVYLGDADRERDEHLDKLPEAERQGPTRYERGRRAFRQAQELAESRGWKFGWRLVVAPGVGHDHQAMFDHELCWEALFGEGP